MRIPRRYLNLVDAGKTRIEELEAENDLLRKRIAELEGKPAVKVKPPAKTKK
jgi:hypothetical protein